MLPLWDRLEPRWGIRQRRAGQPAAAGVAGEPTVRSDDGVRLVRPDEIDTYFPAAVAMFTEEVGVDPRAGDNGQGYRTRIVDLIAEGRSFARFDGDQVVFKAEIGSLSRQVALIQGVWVHPDLRGRGLAAPGMAAVVRAIRANGSGSEPVRQPIQRARAAGLRADRIRAGRPVRLCAVLTSDD